MRRRSALAPHVVGEIHVCRDGERHAELGRFRQPVLEILDPLEVAELAAHEAPPLVRAHELTASPSSSPSDTAFSAHSSPSSGDSAAHALE